MLERVLRLKERYVKATTQEEKNAVDLEMKKLQEEDMEAWANAMVESAKETADRAEVLVKQIRVKEQLENI